MSNESLALKTKLMTLFEVADQSQFSTRTIRRWIKTGLLKPLGGRGGSGMRFAPDDVRRAWRGDAANADEARRGSRRGGA